MYTSTGGKARERRRRAMGLALRALGHGRKVTVVQFLKNGSSGELAPLRALGAAVYAGKTGAKFASQMTPEERAQERASQDACLAKALENPCDLLLLDEACAALAARHGGPGPPAPGGAGAALQARGGADRPRSRALDAGGGRLFHGNALPPPPVRAGRPGAEGVEF